MDTIDLHVVLETNPLRRAIERQAGQAPKQDAKHHLQLDARKYLPQALMNAKAEGKVTPWGSIEIKAVRLVKNGFVAVT